MYVYIRIVAIATYLYVLICSIYMYSSYSYVPVCIDMQYNYVCKVYFVCVCYSNGSIVFISSVAGFVPIYVRMQMCVSYAYVCI